MTNANFICDGWKVPKAAVAVVLRNLIHRMTRGVVKKIDTDNYDVYTKS